MSITVAKFGGSSLADAGQFRKVRDIILSEPNRVFVVPSAPGRRTYKDQKVTDLLYDCHKRHENGEPIDDLFAMIEERYVDIAYELNLSIDIYPHLRTVYENLMNGATVDYAASRGEYLNGLLLADFLQYDFIDAADVIRFDSDEKFDSEMTQTLMSQCLDTHKTAVIPGFYGAMANGEIKTFSRGGSDITGAIVARGANATVYENWTDVSGMLMADPRIVKNPKPIDVVTYSELRELAYMGATVLHDEAIFPVRQACIPINVKNTNMPDDTGTMIVPEADDHRATTITGIAGRKGFTIINVEKDKMNTEVGFAAKLLGVLAEYGISIEHMPTGIDTLCVVISDLQLEGKRQQVIDSILSQCNPDAISIHEDIALIAVVGRGMIRRVGTSALIFSSLSKNGVNVRMIDQGSSEINVIVGVEAGQFSEAMNAIYGAFSNQEM